MPPIFPSRLLLSTSALILLGCMPSPLDPGSSQIGDPTLQSRPHTPALATPLGESMLGIGSATKDGILYIPEGALEAGPLPLVVALHGATGDADNWKGWYSLADSMGFALLAIDSRDYTWDRIQGGFGADVTFLDLALAHVFDRVSIDPTRITLAGFSDGASYALSLGVSPAALLSARIFPRRDQTHRRPHRFH